MLERNKIENVGAHRASGFHIQMKRAFKSHELYQREFFSLQRLKIHLCKKNSALKESLKILLSFLTVAS